MFQDLVYIYLKQSLSYSISDLLNTYYYLFTSKDLRLPFSRLQIENSNSTDLLYIIEEIEFYLQHVRLEELTHFKLDYYLQRTICLQKLLAIEYILEVEQHPQSIDVINNMFFIRYNNIESQNIKKEICNIDSCLDIYA